MSGVLSSEYLSYCPRIKSEVSPQWTLFNNYIYSAHSVCHPFILLWGPHSFLAKHFLHFLLFCAVNLGKCNKRWPLLCLNARLSRNSLCQKKKISSLLLDSASLKFSGHRQDVARCCRNIALSVWFETQGSPSRTCISSSHIWSSRRNKESFVSHLKEGGLHAIFMLRVITYSLTRVWLPEESQESRIKEG